MSAPPRQFAAPTIVVRDDEPVAVDVTLPAESWTENLGWDLVREDGERVSGFVPLRDAPVGYLFEVVSRGYGAMPRYAPQIATKDRWRIVAYVRALQLSQRAELSKLPPGARKSAEASLGGAP